MPRPSQQLHLYAAGRTAALVKHELLALYLEQLAIRVGRSEWSSFFFVDGFAGPWGSSEDSSDSSFGIAVEKMTSVERMLNDKWRKSLHWHAFLIERSRRAFVRLDGFCKIKTGKPVKITAKRGRFENHIDELSGYIDALGLSCFRFLLLDPKGWKGLGMKKISALATGRSSEVLVNVMVKFLVRFLNEPDRAESYEEFFGRAGVREAVKAARKEDRPEMLVSEYCKSLQEICKFEYVSYCLVLDEDREQVRYFLVFATNHHKGIEVFKDAETKASALQSKVVSVIKKGKRENKQGMSELPLFDENSYIRDLKSRYFKLAFDRVSQLLTEHGKILYRTAFCEAAKFPMISASEIHQELRRAKGAKIQLEESIGKKRKTPNCDSLDYLILEDSAPAGRNPSVGMLL